MPRPAGKRREYAVLVPLAERAGALHLLFEVRAETLNRQPGEVCFPGGRLEGAETPTACALRETWEELNIPPETVEVIAPLDFQCQGGGQVFYPVLGHVTPQGLPALEPSPAEVKETFWVPVDFFRNHPPKVYAYELIPHVEDFPYDRIGFPQGYPWRRSQVDVPIYQWEGHTIWGMTARTVRGLMEAMK